MEITRKQLPAQHYLYVDRECAYGPEIAEAMGSAFGELMTFMSERGITPLKSPSTVYLGMDPKILRFRGAMIVAADDAEKAEGNVKADTLPAGAVICGTHVGPYDSLNVSHGALWDHMEKEDIPAGWPIWEIYVDDPGTTDPESLRTEIYRAVG